jgi:hypothetical protein
VADETRHVDLALVHQSPFSSPFNVATQLREPLLRGCGIHQATRVRNASTLVVDENPFTRFEQRYLRY